MGDFETVKEQADLRRYVDEHLEKTRERGKYVCPKCKSGTGKNKTGGFGIMPDGKRANCFVCDWKPDIFELAGFLENADEPAEQLKIVADWAGVSIGSGGGFSSVDWNNVKSAATANESALETQKGEKGTDTAETDYSAGRERHRRYIAECAERMRTKPTEAVLSYLYGRGFQPDEIAKLNIGYDPNYKGKGETRIILPWAGCDYYHIDRALKDVPGKYNKPGSDEVGAQPIYNPQAFDKDYIFVVEGAMDAIALQLCGFNAVALGGTSSNNFATEAAARKYSGVVIDMLDADGEPDEQGKGRAAGAKLSALMEKEGVTCLTRAEYGIGDGDTYGGHKDAGEWFAADRDGLTLLAEKAREGARAKSRDRKSADYRAALKTLNVKRPELVADDILNLRGMSKPVPTGITRLDETLGGGVSMGELTIFGAISSYGKTTLAVQVADRMAKDGHPVLFVTIEQSARELVAKSLARLVYAADTKRILLPSPQEIMSLDKREQWSEGQRDRLNAAVEEYRSDIAPHLKILEGNGQPTVADIRTVATVIKENEGKPPIIFVDYLQLLAPKSNRESDKQAVDYNVGELRRLARDLNTHIWCISSLNRSSYSGIISLDSYKESGMIEYGADNLLGLQPFDMENELGDEKNDGKRKRMAEKLVKESKAKDERDCELVILKQRNGALPDEPMPLVFKPRCAAFYEPVAVVRSVPDKAKDAPEV